jgi:hypothetical protein
MQLCLYYRSICLFPSLRLYKGNLKNTLSRLYDGLQAALGPQRHLG